MSHKDFDISSHSSEEIGQVIEEKDEYLVIED